MGAVRIEIAHRRFPRPRRIFVWHRQHPLDQVGDVLRIAGLFFRGDGANTAFGVVARPPMRTRRARQLWRGRFERTARSGLLIEVFHFARPKRRDPSRGESYPGARQLVRP
jgi:hypothetical protein